MTIRLKNLTLLPLARASHARPEGQLALALVYLFALFTVGCSGGGGGDSDVGVDADMDQSPDVESGFDDHTVPRIDNEAEFFGLAAEGPTRSAAKFVVTNFMEEETGTLYMDANFYTLHDEWYWFRLLNGQPVPGVETAPLVGSSFSTIQEIYDWAESVENELPLDLQFVSDGRLYSPEFYKFSLREPRHFGLGSIIHVPARSEPEPRPEFWLFELEYSDRLDHSMLMTYFEALESTLPTAVAEQLLWVVRSPHQDALAVEMEAEKLEYWDRVVRWRDVIIPGEVEVYAEGLTAGRLRVVRAGEPGLEASRETDILITEEVPDWLPPASGLITGLPQTPLAHVNVLARNRGIPNAYFGGVVDDPDIDQLSRVQAPVIVRAIAPDQLDIAPMSEEQYATWRGMGDVEPISVPEVDTSSLPYLVDLADYDAAELTEEDLEALRPVIGGKATGFLGLASPGVVTMPDRPMTITVRAYFEHLESVQPALNAMLANLDFRTSSRARFLLLEGAEDYRLRYKTDEDMQFLDSFYQQHPAGTWVGDILRADGFKKYLRNQPLAPGSLTAIETGLESQFGHYSNRQGLRFRSSSSVEDIEGFNGAGLYDSNTGFLVPSAQEPDDRHQDVEWAIKKTWSSYWSFEAFEERRLEKVEHLSGGMAVLVHARFDDDKELSNGVFTFTVLPDTYNDSMVMELNVQDGAESVTNPTPGLNALPEVNRVVLARGAQMPSIERMASSNLVPEGTRILSDAELLQIFDQARAVTETWLQRQNEARGPARAASTLTLDFEFRDMADNWPDLYIGENFSRRIVIKQARSLEPGLRRIPDTMVNLPFPTDLLARTRRGVRRECESDLFTLVTVDATTDPILYPDMGYQLSPFTSFVSLGFNGSAAEIGVMSGQRVVLDHTAFSASHPGVESGGDWTLTVDIPGDEIVSTFEIGANGEYRVANGMGEVTGSVTCSQEILLTTPQDYLASILEESAP